MTYFSVSFFRESMRRSRGIAILCMAVSFLASCLSPLIEMMQHIGSEHNEVQLVSARSFAGLMPYVCLAFPLLFGLKLFGFLFKRGSSDFYHALPFKRECMYITNFVAMLCWYAIVLAVTLGICALFYAIDPVMRFRPLLILYNFILYMVMFIQVSGAVLIAVSVVGKMSIAFTLSGIILFLPRAIFLIAMWAIGYSAPMLVYDAVPFFSAKYSLAFSLTGAELLGLYDTDSIFCFTPGIVQSFIVGVVYLVIGCYLFTVRKSETAENASPNRTADIVMQIAYSAIFFIAAATFSFVYGLFDETMFIFVLIGLVVFIAYEGVATRSIKKTIKSLPRLGIVLAICVIYAALLGLVSDSLLHKNYSADDIKSVQTFSSSDHRWSSWEGESGTYTAIRKDGVWFKDSEICSIIAEGYNEYCRRMQNSDEHYYFREGRTMEVKFKTGGFGTKVRRIFITEDQNDRLLDLMSREESYKKAISKLPGSVYVSGFETKEHNEQIWESFKKEYDDLLTSDKMQVSGVTENEERSVGTIHVSGYHGVETFSQNYDISEKLMPETAALYRKFEYEENVEIIEAFREKVKTGRVGSGNGHFEIRPDDALEDVCGIMIYLYFSSDGSLNNAVVSLEVSYDSYSTTLSAAATDSEARELVERMFDCIELGETASSDYDLPAVATCYYNTWSYEDEDFSANLHVGLNKVKFSALAEEIREKCGNTPQNGGYYNYDLHYDFTD